MNIQRDKVEEGVEILTVTLEQADYEENATKSLKKIRREANMPGFRPGMVPMSVIKKKFYKQILEEEINKTAYDSFNNYVSEQKLKLVCKVVDMTMGTDFVDVENLGSVDYKFKIATASDFDVDVIKGVSIERPVQIPSEKMIQQAKKSVMAQYGKFDEVGEISSDIEDMTAEVTLSLDNGDLKIESSKLHLAYSSENIKKFFAGKKVGEKFQVNINDVFDVETQKAAILQIDKEKLNDVNPEFSMEIVQIKDTIFPELNDEFYEKAFPDKDVVNEEQFDLKMKKDVSERLSFNNKYRYQEILRKRVLDMIQVTLPESYLRNFFEETASKQDGKSLTDDDFAAILKQIKWDVISSEILAKAGVELNYDTILEGAMRMLSSQYSMYGITIPQDKLKERAVEMLHDEKELEYIYQLLQSDYTFENIMKMATINDVELQSDEFEEYMKKALNPDA